MARRTEDVWIEEEGRDKGKLFTITEMPADRAEEWAIRAWLALSRAGVVVPEETADQGMWAVAAAGLPALSRIAWEDAKPLLDEMWQCVRFIPNPQTRHVGDRVPMSQDVEEVATRMLLRIKVFNLHVGFSSAAAPSTSGPAAATSAAGPHTATSLRH